FLLLGAHEIKSVHYQGSDLIGTSDIPKNLIESIDIQASKTSDGLVSISTIEVVECISVNAKGKKKLQTHRFNLMPALLGENTSPVNIVSDILWAQESRNTIVQTLQAWNKSIQENK
ncbi:MAG: hypothetical protein AABZ56_01445, partial [Bacteroidota bacterium]